MGKQFSLKPLEDRVVVKASEGDETTASGIVIPDTAKERPQEGEVMAAGPGRFEDGQRIACSSLGAQRFSLLPPGSDDRQMMKLMLAEQAHSMAKRVVRCNGHQLGCHRFAYNHGSFPLCEQV